MIVVFGAAGQLGRAFRELLPKGACISLSRADADFSKPDLLPELLKKIQEKYHPSWVINAAGYTQVDLAEKEEDIAFLINAESPGILAKWCAANQTRLIQFSTDYVFNGVGATPWTEETPTAPLGAYARTKQAGENFVLNSGCEHLIIRSSWIFDRTGKNFLTTMMKLGSEKETLKIVSDQIGAPTFAIDLVRAVIQIIEVIEIRDERTFPSGIYHLCSGGETSWHGFAQRIFEVLRSQGTPLQVKSVLSIPSTEYPSPALRPKNSRLSCQKALRTFGVELPSWEEGLKNCLKADF